MGSPPADLCPVARAVLRREIRAALLAQAPVTRVVVRKVNLDAIRPLPVVAAETCGRHRSTPVRLGSKDVCVSACCEHGAETAGAWRAIDALACMAYLAATDVAQECGFALYFGCGTGTGTGTGTKIAPAPVSELTCVRTP